jgi:pimeloyl-ACP methyl ester carboxylesterase
MAEVVERIEVRSKDGTLIPAWRSGRGCPLLLVHGAGADHSAWGPARPYLEAQFSVVAMDRRCSFGDVLARYDLEREFEDVAAVAESLGPEVDVVGHSSGALCALGAAPLLTNLRRLILYEPPLTGDHWPALSRRLDALQAQGDLEGIFETFFLEAVRVPPSFIEARRAAPGWPQMLQSARFFPREVSALSRWRFEPERLRSLGAPVLLLIGGDTPPGHHHRGYIEALRPLLGRLEVGELAGQGHAAHVLAPEAFTEVVLEFLMRENTVEGGGHE